MVRKHITTFKEELRTSLNTAFLAAFGFLIALVWRDLITKWIHSLAEHTPLSGELMSALLITIVCVLGIMLISKIFPKEEKNN